MIAFIFAHPDDETFGPIGTIIRKSKEDEILIVSMCVGTRPGAKTGVSIKRQEAFEQICDSLNAKSVMLDYNDCRLENVTQEVVDIVNQYKPHTIYTHSLNDVHRDHRLVAEACLVAARPKTNSSVNNLLFCEIPSSTEWAFGQYGSFTPNVYEDITDLIEQKKEKLSLYATETYDYPDARSIEHVVDLARLRGSQSGFQYAEAFQLVFSRNHKTQ